MGRLFTLDEASKMMGVSKQTLRNWDNSGKMVAKRTSGNRRFYEEETIIKYVKDSKLMRLIGGEKWYLREFDFLPEPISNRLDKWPLVHPSLNSNEVVGYFKRGDFNWFDSYDECAKASISIRKNLNFPYTVDDEEFIGRIRKNSFRDAGYDVD